MTKEKRKRIKDAIVEIEYYRNGLKHLSEACVKVVNLLTTRKDVYIYDCILYGDNQRYNDCQISKSHIDKHLAKEVK